MASRPYCVKGSLFCEKAEQGFFYIVTMESRIPIKIFPRRNQSTFLLSVIVKG